MEKHPVNDEKSDTWQEIARLGVRPIGNLSHIHSVSKELLYKYNPVRTKRGINSNYC